MRAWFICSLDDSCVAFPMECMWVLGFEASKDSSSSSSSWLSPSGEFAFGFRATNNDQNLYLLGIWYDKIPDKTIVWWANGDNPAPEGSKVELTTKGQFILSGPKDSSSDLGGGPCGSNGFCRLDANRRPICDCLPGFSPLDPTNKFNGCKPDKQVTCDSSNSKPEDMYNIQELSNTFWPGSSNFEQLQGFNENDCSKSCLYDCNCVVAFIREGTCWKKLPLSNGRQDWDVNGKALIKFPKHDVPSDESLSEDRNTRKKDQATLILAGALLLGSSVFLNLLFVAAVIFIFLTFYKRRHRNTYRSSLLDANLQTFTYKDLQEATNGFKEELGRGAFGTAYKGVIFSSSSRTYVAVKKLDKLQLEGEKEFKTEVSIIAKTNHKNLVRLLGFCDEGPNKLLVYEFMSNGTVASFLFGISRPDWNKRIQIASGIARGIIGTRGKSLDMGRENEEEVILVDWVYDFFKARRLSKLVEEDEEARNDMKRLERLVMVALWCIQEDPSLRPSMKKVIQMLEGVVDVLVPPCPSPFSSTSFC
ncbi:hypothetical protein K1719_012649 [Acacia pycnantha]|nr:hypothetical protein K1719_012649 [Acacia pycnantha]